MNTAYEIMASSSNANAADEKASALAISVDQDWEHEATLYTFADDSVLVSSGPQINAFADMAAARAALTA